MKANKYLTKEQVKRVDNSFLKLKPQFMSLVCFSLIGTSLYANSDWTGSGEISCNVSTCTISTPIFLNNGSITGTGNLKNLAITSSGTINVQGTQQAILVNDGTITNLKNDGIIQSDDSGNAMWLRNDTQIQTLENSGTAFGGSDGINVGNNTSIENFNNSGIIKAINNSGIGLGENATIMNLNNSGTIESNDRYGISLASHSKIQTLENSGTIRATNRCGICLWDSGAIDNLNNSGIIESSNKNGIFLMNNNRIQTVENSGLILGAERGVNLQENSSINNFSNTGTIRATNHSGIGLGSSATLGVLNNSGTIESTNKDGILLTGSSRIQTIENSELIFGAERGVNLQENSSINNFSNAGTIRATNHSGIGLGDNATIGILSNNGGTIESTNKDGILLMSSSRIQTVENLGIILGAERGTYLEGSSSINNFSNSGTIRATNHSGIGLSSSATLGVLNNSGTIESTTGSGVTLAENSKIQTLKNLGALKATNGVGIGLRDHASIDNLANIGTIESIRGLGMQLTEHSKITTLKNLGTITITDGYGIGLWDDATIDILANSKTIKTNNGSNITLSGSSKIKTLENLGTLQTASGTGVTLRGSATIDNLTNNKTIKTDNGNNITLSENSKIKTLKNLGNIKTTKGIGINLQGHSTIDNMNNNGVIESSNSYGMVLAENSKIQTIENSKVIFGGADAIYTRGNVSIDNLNNSGTIEAIFGSGISLNGSTTIDNLTNSGTIESQSESGISLGDNSTIKTINNSGFISGYMDGISSEWGASIDNLENSGTIKALQGSGIALAKNATLRNLNNTGTIESLLEHGIWLADNSKIQTIQKLGTIIGNTDGIHAQGNAVLSSINIQSNDKIEGKTGYGINIQGKAEVTGDITVSGELKGGLGIIKNSGTLGGSVEIKKGAKISVTSGAVPAVINKGLIGGSVKNEGDKDFSLDNQGHIKQGIINTGGATMNVTNSGMIDPGSNNHMVENSGTGKIRILSWEIDNDDFGIPGELSVGGSNAKNVFVDTLVLDQGGLDLDYLDSIDHFVSGIDHGNIKNVITNGSGEIKLNYNSGTGKFKSFIDLNEGIAGIASKNFSRIQTQRSSFIDTVMSSSEQTLHHKNRANTRALNNNTNNLYASAENLIQSDVLRNASYAATKDNSLFVLPYFSSINVDLDSSQKGKGHTRGVILGYHVVKDSGIWGFYAGYEDTKTANSHYFDVSSRTYYTGLKYFNTIYRTQKGYEIYAKAGTNLGKVNNDLTKNIGSNNTANAHPTSYIYGVNSDVGVNLSYGKNVFSPEIGLAYDGSYTQAFSMENTLGDAVVKGGERYYVNKTNIFSSRASVSWFRDWLPKLKTVIQAGIKVNFNPQVKLRARFGNRIVSDHYNLPTSSAFTKASLIVPLNDAFTFTVNYNGSFSDESKNHSVYTQFNYFY